jgi:hypothetical protein
MEDVLAKLGYGDTDIDGELILGTEQFDLIDGDNSLGSSYMDFPDFITSPEAMAQHSIIFIDCGNDYEGLMFSDPDVIDNIRNYVNNGGKLYVTDLSYDFVEQPFPQFIDFYGSDATPTSDPEEWDAAEEGRAGITTNAEVLDSNLSDWLNARGALNPDGTVHIEGFLAGWAVMNGTASGAKVWIRGDVEFAGTSGVKPLTVTFDYGSNGGRVLYTSYHTEDTEDPSLRPQEYVLAYLIFEL